MPLPVITHHLAPKLITPTHCEQASAAIPLTITINQLPGFAQDDSTINETQFLTNGQDKIIRPRARHHPSFLLSISENGEADGDLGAAAGLNLWK